MKKIIAVCIAALALGGCSVTWQEARARLDSAIATGTKVARLGAYAICESYPTVVVAFDTVAVTGFVNATTVRDVRVAVEILDTSCPAVQRGDASATAAISIVRSTYSILMQAAAEARRQHAMRAT